MQSREHNGSTICILGALFLLATVGTAYGQCGVCDSGGICDSQVGITGGFVQVCGDGQWTSLAFPFNTGGALVDTFTAVHNTNTGVGDIYIMGGTCGGPNVNNILVTLCGAIQGAPSGVPVDYCFDPVFTSPVDPTWVVLVFNSSFSFDVAFNGATQGLGTLGTVYGNLEGGADPALWQDLVNFGFDACYCVSLSLTGCTPPPTAACCLPSGDCIITGAASCAAVGGEYQGDGVDCESGNCPPPTCPADTNGDGSVDGDDLTNVILDWGTDGSTHGGDVDGTGLVDVDDLTAVILGWGPCP